MKRAFTIVLSVMLVMAMVQVSMAGPGCTSKTEKSADGTNISSKAQCSAADAAACAARLGMDPEECKTLCATGEYTMVSMSVKGMTCEGCENSISATLAELPGVVKVGKVSHKDGTAFVLVDPKKSKDSKLVDAVVKKGYEAQIIPAVATTGDVNATAVNATKACGMTASKDGKAGCSKSCATTCGAKAKTTDKTKKADKTEGTL